MILVLADTPREIREISRAAGGRVRAVDSARELVAQGSDVEAVLVACRSHRLHERMDLLARLERERPWVPVVLVTDCDPEVAKLLSAARVAAMVWYRDIQTCLMPRLDALRVMSGMLALAATFERSVMPRALRRSLVYAARQAATRPVHSVRELAAAVGCSPVTLFQQFAAHADGNTTLAGFIGGLTVLRAYELRRAGRSWTQVLDGVPIRRATLVRRVRAWPGCTLERLRGIAPDQLFELFTVAHVRPILGDGIRDIYSGG